MGKELIKKLTDAVVNMNSEEALELTGGALESGISSRDILNNGLLPALDKVGVLFQDGDYFLPDILTCANIYKSTFALIESELKKGNYKPMGKIMLGTVWGDTHDIGKNILAALLEGNGFEVINLGMNVAPETFLEKAKETGPDIIGMSALLTTTMPEMKKVIDLFSAKGLRDKYRFIIGGAPVSPEYADTIGADGYGAEAQEGVDLVKSFF